MNFISNDCPLALNLPNYEHLKEQGRMKNFYFPNVYEDFYEENLNFCSKNDCEILCKLGLKAFILHLALHELMGHASVKYLKKDEYGNLNFDPEKTINPITNNLIEN